MREEKGLVLVYIQGGGGGTHIPADGSALERSGG